MTSRHMMKVNDTTLFLVLLAITAKKFCREENARVQERSYDKLDDNPSRSSAPHIADHYDILYYNALDKRRGNTNDSS
jgi:hypothetical protein